MDKIDFTKWTDTQLAVAANPKYKSSPNYPAVLAEIQRRKEEKKS